MMIFLVRTWLAARLARSERGANLVEYILLLGFIAIVVIAAVAFVGGALDSRYDQSGSIIDDAVGN